MGKGAPNKFRKRKNPRNNRAANSQRVRRAREELIKKEAESKCPQPVVPVVSPQPVVPVVSPQPVAPVVSPQPAAPVVSKPKEKKSKKPKESPKKRVSKPKESPKKRVSKPKESPKKRISKPKEGKGGKRKVPRSPSPTANVPAKSHTDPLRLCIVKMEIEDDGYNENENYLESLPSTSSKPSPENSFTKLPSLKSEPSQEIVPTVYKILVPTVKPASSNKQTVEEFFANVAETVKQLPPHLIEQTKAKVSTLVYDMVIQAISEGTNIQQPKL